MTPTSALRSTPHSDRSQHRRHHHHHRNSRNSAGRCQQASPSNRNAADNTDGGGGGGLNLAFKPVELFKYETPVTTPTTANDEPVADDLDTVTARDNGRRTPLSNLVSPVASSAKYSPAAASSVRVKVERFSPPPPQPSLVQPQAPPPPQPSIPAASSVVVKIERSTPPLAPIIVAAPSLTKVCASL